TGQSEKSVLLNAFISALRSGDKIFTPFIAPILLYRYSFIMYKQTNRKVKTLSPRPLFFSFFPLPHILQSNEP
ncbi:MAG: hypothetical protein LBK61_08020, partial [Spirochaetaceae bacterium]|nr:hypothetical protein [Spirochaetaceae bacterium]